MDVNMQVNVVINTSDSDEERPGTPIELIEAATEMSIESLPKKSRERYMQVYNQYQAWKKSKNATSNSERVVIAYFGEMGQNKRPTTLWACYSMLKATLKIYDNINIGTYAKLVGILKSKAAGYRPKKATTLTEGNIKKFIDEATDATWLDVKVALIFAICGCCRTHELPEIKLEDIKDVDDMEDVFLVRIVDTKTKTPRGFTICGSFYKIVQQYAALRPSHATTDKFFLNYQKGKCTIQTIGKNKFYKMPGRIAAYLNLPDTAGYTGHSFRRSSASVYANAGATIEALKRFGFESNIRIKREMLLCLRSIVTEHQL